MTPGNRRVIAPATPNSEDAAAEALASETTASKTKLQRAIAVLRAVVGFVLVASTSVGVAWVARRHVLGSPRFAIAEVQVVGNERRPADALVVESGLTVGSNVFAADLDLAHSKIMADPWIAEADLARRLPGTILIHVVEHRAAAMVALDDLYLATAEGEPFKKLEPGDPTDLPLVTGLRPEALAEDREGLAKSVRRGIDLAAEFEHGPLARRAPLEEVHIGGDGSFALVVGHSAIELVLGAPPFRRKLDQAARAFAELEKRGGKADAIMLDNDARPERVVVRTR